MQGNYSVAIDGPSGAGKSTIARAAAKRFGFLYVDTGAIYRTVGLAVERCGFEAGDEASVKALLPKLDITLGRDGGGVQTEWLNGEDVSGLIRTPEISRRASEVSAMPSVRGFLLDMQRSLAASTSVIMDGRDIGTVVFPDAELKIFMTADPRVRACRRYDELRAKGDQVSLEEIERNVRERDKADMGRAISPLRQAEDAIVLDNSCMTVGEQMAWFRKEFEQVTR